MLAQKPSYLVAPNPGDNSNGSEVPTGTIFTYAGANAPSGWLMCDGTAVSRATYADLFALIGTTYGIGNGTTTFNVPNTQNRTVRGKGTSVFSNLGAVGGNDAPNITATQSLTISANNLPPHKHGTFDAGTSSAIAGGALRAGDNNVDIGTRSIATYLNDGTTVVANTPLSISAVATAQSVVNQFIVFNYIIKD